MNRLWLSFVLSAAAIASQAQNQGAILTHGNDQFSYGAVVANGVSTGLQNLPTSSAATSAVSMNWNVDSAAAAAPRLRHAFRGDWYYRIDNDSRERNPANMNIRNFSGDRVDYFFTAVGPGSATINGLTAQMCYQVIDTGVNQSMMATWLCFDNQTSNTYTIETFFAMDLDLLGTFGGDTGLPTQFGGGRLLTTVDGGDTGIIFGPNAIGSGVGLHTDILGKLTNNVVDSWTNDLNAGGTGPGDLQGLVQFSTIVTPGQQFCTPVYVGVGINGQIPVVAPEPSSLLFFCLGIPALLRRRRGR